MHAESSRCRAGGQLLHFLQSEVRMPGDQCGSRLSPSGPSASHDTPAPTCAGQCQWFSRRSESCSCRSMLQLHLPRLVSQAFLDLIVMLRPDQQASITAWGSCIFCQSQTLLRGILPVPSGVHVLAGWFYSGKKEANDIDAVEAPDMVQCCALSLIYN